MSCKACAGSRCADKLGCEFDAQNSLPSRAACFAASSQILISLLGFASRENFTRRDTFGCATERSSCGLDKAGGVFHPALHGRNARVGRLDCKKNCIPQTIFVPALPARWRHPAVMRAHLRAGVSTHREFHQITEASAL